MGNKIITQIDSKYFDYQSRILNNLYIKPPSWEEIIHEDWQTSKILPWAHLQGPLNEERLIQHQLLALKENHNFS